MQSIKVWCLRAAANLIPLTFMYLGQQGHTQHSACLQSMCSCDSLRGKMVKFPQTKLPLQINFELKFHSKWIITLAVCQWRCVPHFKYWIQSNRKICLPLKIHNLALWISRSTCLRADADWNRFTRSGSTETHPSLYTMSYHNITKRRTNGRIKNKKEMISLKHLLWNYKGRIALFK